MDFDKLGSWGELLGCEWDKPYVQELINKVNCAYAADNPSVYPPREDVFRAFELTAPEAVRCLVLGQVILSSAHMGMLGILMCKQVTSPWF